MKKIIFPVFIALILYVGISTDLKFSDEIFHFWFAKDWYTEGSRPIYNKLVDTIEEINNKRYYENDPLWHLVLHYLFGISPHHQKAIAQTYQVFFYLMLIIGTYLLAKELYDDEIALYASILTATTPFFVAFSILLFIDLPVASLTPFLFLFLVRKNYLATGFLLGLTFLMKKNAYLLFPSIVLFLSLNGLDLYKYSFKKVLYSISIILLVALTLNINDLFFKYEYFNGIVAVGDKGHITKYLTLGKAAKESKIEQTEKKNIKEVSNVYFTESIKKPKNVLKFIGLPFLLLLGFYIYKSRRLFQRQDLFLILTTVIYIFLFVKVFKNYYAVRYLSPILPLVAILSAKAIRLISRARLRAFIVFICLVQFSVTLIYVYEQRRLTVDELNAFNYVKKLNDTSGRILTTDELFVSYYTMKPTVWSKSFQGQGESLYDLLWGEKITDKINVFTKYNIKYIFIPNSRVYDDSNIKYFGGFPESFIKSLHNYAEVDYSNPSITLWRIKGRSIDGNN